MIGKITIIIPCYNQAFYLNECLGSVMDQTYHNWECIIINDGSTDKTEEIALNWQKRDSRFSYHKIKNSGVSNARNYALNISKGDYIQFLDGDDILHRDKLSTQINYLEANKEIDIVYGPSRYFYKTRHDELLNVHPTGLIPTIESFRFDNQTNILSSRNICAICAPLYRSKIKSIKFKNELFEDWVFNKECNYNGFIFEYLHSSATISFIRITNNSKMMNDIKESLIPK